METIIEYRDKLDGKLKEIVLDGPAFTIDKMVETLKGQGHTEVNIVKH